ncbi:GerAB/ArcD/ProY family transporter [Neobacillus sp. PS3-34]|uniref:GerAB/ArcD/ProY family transporter n=1 Tax=Neobacillus sp. PS3-34 TaxID=3070678 RepID=UPI0027DFEA0E|nr:GerAB/ArcD/ProY family transporter [Neobacillus sp. PS3-34]WML46999.1 GerAB/ArcD/ProY family transporter [Neobacillus sp. PS3-34]
MDIIKIKPFQLFVLVFLYEMGSAIVVGIASGLKQDAWMAVLLGLTGGILLFLVYHRLFSYYPDLPLTGYVQKITGKFIGRILGFLYIVYFIYCATRVTRDIGELLTTTIYTNTPLFIINTLMILTVIYAIHKGLEVLARVGELLFMIVYLMAIAGFLLVVFSGLIHLENLKPILENGIMPVIKKTLGETITFPFGEMIIFTMILPTLNEPNKAKMVCLGGMVLAGINITITTIINITSLGTDLIIRSPFPLLSTIAKIELMNFIERLDVFFMLYLVIGGFFKITLYFYAAVVGATDLFNLKNQSKLSFPIGFIILFSSITIASNYAEHIKEGLNIVPIYLHWPFQIVIPMMLLIIAFFRNRKKKQKASTDQAENAEGMPTQ